VAAQTTRCARRTASGTTNARTIAALRTRLASTAVRAAWSVARRTTQQTGPRTAPDSWWLVPTFVRTSAAQTPNVPQIAPLSSRVNGPTIVLRYLYLPKPGTYEECTTNCDALPAGTERTACQTQCTRTFKCPASCVGSTAPDEYTCTQNCESCVDQCDGPLSYNPYTGGAAYAPAECVKCCTNECSAYGCTDICTDLGCDPVTDECTQECHNECGFTPYPCTGNCHDNAECAGYCHCQDSAPSCPEPRYCPCEAGVSQCGC
jgi:hypothetical protein